MKFGLSEYRTFEIHEKFADGRISDGYIANPTSIEQHDFKGCRRYLDEIRTKYPAQEFVLVLHKENHYYSELIF